MTFYSFMGLPGPPVRLVAGMQLFLDVFGESRMNFSHNF